MPLQMVRVTVQGWDSDKEKPRRRAFTQFGKTVRDLNSEDYRRLFEAERAINELTSLRIHVDVTVEVEAEG